MEEPYCTYTSEEEPYCTYTSEDEYAYEEGFTVDDDGNWHQISDEDLERGWMSEWHRAEIAALAQELDEEEEEKRKKGIIPEEEAWDEEDNADTAREDIQPEELPF